MEEGEEYSPEEAEGIVSKPIRLAIYAEKFFQKDDVDRLLTLINHSTIRDIDFLYLTGSVGIEEAIEYFMFFPDVQALLVELKMHAYKMAASVSEKIPRYMSGVYDLWKKKVKAGPIKKMLRRASDCIEVPSNARRIRYGIGSAAGYFNQNLMGALLIAMNREVARRYPDHQCEISHKVQNDDDESDTGTCYPKVYGGVHSFTHHFLRDPKFEKLRKMFEGETHDESLLQEMFREIQSLAQFRSISFIKPINEDLTYEFFDCIHAEEKNLERILHVCSMIITAKYIGKPDVKFALSIDRCSGDLSFCGALLKDMIEVEKERALRYKLYTFLLEYLRSTKEDIPRAPATPPQKKITPAIVVEETLRELGEIVLEDESEATTQVEPSTPQQSVTLVPERKVDERANRLEPEESFIGYSKYRVAVERLREAIEDAHIYHGGKLHALRVKNDKIAGKFIEKWESLLQILGFAGRIHWMTIEQVGETSHRDVPLLVPHSLNTHLSEGWKRRRRNVYVIPVSSPGLLMSYLKSLEEQRAFIH